MRPELLLRDVGACLHEDRSQQAFSDGIVVRNGQRLDAAGASALHFYVLRAGCNHEAEALENADDVRTRENLKSSLHMIGGIPRSWSRSWAGARSLAMRGLRLRNKRQRRRGCSPATPRTLCPR